MAERISGPATLCHDWPFYVQNKLGKFLPSAGIIDLLVLSLLFLVPGPEPLILETSVSTR